MPTVVHLVHENGSEKLMESEVEAAISFINTTLHNSNTPIELVLAKVDPDGNCTNGITDENFDPILTNPIIDVNHEEVIATYNWNQNEYLNIAIVRNILNGQFGNTEGYGTVPFSVNLDADDGIVLRYDFFEDVTSVHELGHYLGLLHIWGFDGHPCIDQCGTDPEVDCDSSGDRVCDTPPIFSILATTNCDPTFTGCYTSECDNGNFDMVAYPKENFMASGTKNCHNDFTELQEKRMYWHLNNFRRDLWYPGYIIKKEMIVEEETKFHKDINIYAGGRLVIEAEAIMAEGISIIVHEGGQLVVEGGHIRGCENEEGERSNWNGINVIGVNADGYSVEFKTKELTLTDPLIEDVEGFAVTTNNNAFFTPAASVSLVNTTFNNVDGLLNLNSFLPLDDNSIIDNCTQNGGVYGVKNINSLQVEILSNKFFDIQKECVSTINGSFDIRANEFHGNEVDVVLVNFFGPGNRSLITNNNEFRGNGYGIRAAGSTRRNHIIESNIFYGINNSDGSDVDIDIYMDGITDYTIQDNRFMGRLGVSSRATINTTASPNGQNLVDDNEFIGNRIGIFPHFSNPNYFFTNNCFSTRFIDASILGFVPNQGNGNGAPANNCFTHQGNPIGSTVIDIGGAPDPFDYVDPVENDLDCRMPVLAHPNVNVLYTNDNPPITCFHSDEERANENNSNGLDFTLYSDYSVLSTNIIQGEFQAARQQLIQMDQSDTEGIDLHFVASELIDFYENVEGDIEQDNVELIQNLKTIALKDHPSSGYAQAFHYYLTGDFADNLDLDILELDDINERSSVNQETKEQDKKLILYPNPSSDILHIENANLIQRLNVYDLMGNSIFESEEVSIISTKEWLSGVYIFTIIQKNAEVITEKILINK